MFLKVWNLTNCKLKTNHYGHTGYLNTVTVSPDGSLCASGGKDGKAMLWDLNEGKHLYTLDGGNIINSLCFSPNRYWLCAATGPSIKIWVRFVLEFTWKYFWVYLELCSQRFLVQGRPVEQRSDNKCWLEKSHQNSFNQDNTNIEMLQLWAKFLEFEVSQLTSATLVVAN